MPQQICQSCQKNIATVHEFIVVSKDENHLCEECYQKLHLQKPGPVLQIELLQKLFLSGNFPDKTKARKDTACPSCGLRLSEFKRQGQLGCEECYQIFRQALDPLLENVHEATKHIGSRLQESQDDMVSPAHLRQQYKKLQRQLDALIKAENYEDAAHIRDQIKSLEKELEAQDAGEES